VARDTFIHRETASIVKLLDEAAARSGVSRGQAFEDFLAMSLCALSGGQMEDEYLHVVKKHAHGEVGRRGCDSIAAAFGRLVEIMGQTRADILGDIFEGAITRGEAGQYLTPEPVCDLMARLTLDGAAETEATSKTIGDPCCGSGRLLLAAAQVRPGWELVGQDIDLRCVRMTALNLALRNLYGKVIWGDSLRDQCRLAYRTGLNLRGFVRELPIEEATAETKALQDSLSATGPASTETIEAAETPQVPRKQLHLF